MIGYARVSTDDQSTAVQIEQLEALGCDKLFVENASGKNAEMERKRILQRCNEGRAKAKADGKHLGRKADTALHESIKQLYAEGLNKSQIANQLNISRTTVYSVLN
ncbi:TPA: recombinase family protein [Yersinia enterocolitica]|nr:recombinase family protein [Yersinia enterocolitica]